MMYKVTSLVVAQAIIEQAMHIINSDENMPAALVGEDHKDFRIAVECYQNGREHGFIAWPMFYPDLAYFVCQSRRSDYRCIYRGQYSMQSISDDAYKHPNTFETDEVAAEWLVLDLIQLYNSKKAEAADKAAKAVVEPKKANKT